jgi:hypothetical protein
MDEPIGQSVALEARGPSAERSHSQGRGSQRRPLQLRDDSLASPKTKPLTALESTLGRSLAQTDAGEFVDADEVLDELRRQ